MYSYNEVDAKSPFAFELEQYSSIYTFHDANWFPASETLLQMRLLWFSLCQ